MDPPLINEASFTAAANPSSYSLAGFLSFQISDRAVGLRMGSIAGGGGGEGDSSVEESTVTEHSGNRCGKGCGKRRRNAGNFVDDGSSKLVSTGSANQDLNESILKCVKASGSRDENGIIKTEVEANTGDSSRPSKEKSRSEPPKDYIHVRARRGQATDSHSLAERARREKISERMKILQELVPGCNKVIGKALVLDEIINYIQSLQCQVEFLSMKLEAVNSRLNPTTEGFPSKDLAFPAFDATGLMHNSSKEYAFPSQTQWLHMQIGSCFGNNT